MRTFVSGLIALLFAVSSAQAGEKTPDTIAGTTKVNAEKLIELVESTADLVLVDARTQADFGKGHIPDAISLPNTETNAAALAKIIPSKDTPVLFYCNGVNCGRSVVSCQEAVKAGYTKVYWFRGGIGEWKEKGYPLES